MVDSQACRRSATPLLRSCSHACGEGVEKGADECFGVQ